MTRSTTPSQDVMTLCTLVRRMRDVILDMAEADDPLPFCVQDADTVLQDIEQAACITTEGAATYRAAVAHLQCVAIQLVVETEVNAKDRHGWPIMTMTQRVAYEGDVRAACTLRDAVYALHRLPEPTP